MVDIYHFLNFRRNQMLLLQMVIKLKKVLVLVLVEIVVIMG